jgi:hypothetical protein
MSAPAYDPANDQIGHPERFGPGTWWTLSTEAANATTIDLMLQFVVILNLIVTNLPCSKCRNHATEYVKNNPPTQAKYFDMKDADGNCIGMAYYMWEFHNTVNARLTTEGKPKPQFPWDLFLPRYRHGGKKCDHPICTDANHVEAPLAVQMSGNVITGNDLVSTDASGRPLIAFITSPNSADRRPVYQSAEKKKVMHKRQIRTIN